MPHDPERPLLRLNSPRNSHRRRSGGGGSQARQFDRGGRRGRTGQFFSACKIFSIEPTPPCSYAPTRIPSLPNVSLSSRLLGRSRISPTPSRVSRDWSSRARRNWSLTSLTRTLSFISWSRNSARSGKSYRSGRGGSVAGRYQGTTRPGEICLRNCGAFGPGGRQIGSLSPTAITSSALSKARPTTNWSESR